MKTIIAIFLASVSFAALADSTCTVFMSDRYGNVLQKFTRYSYSYEAACSEAFYDCNQDRSEREVRGNYGLSCFEQTSYPAPTPNYPTPYPPTYPAPYPTPYPPSYPAPYPPSYPPRYPAPLPPRYPAPYPQPLPPREPHWPDHGPDRPLPPREPHWPDHGPRR